MITMESRGNFKHTFNFLEKALEVVHLGSLDKYGQEGVEALASATPIDTGKTAASWTYRIERQTGSASIVWYNSNVVNGVNVAVLLQYGHATKNGGYVRGIDYINPALQPIFDKIANNAWKEITTS